MLLIFMLAAVSCTQANAAPATMPADAPGDEGQTVTIAGARQYDFTSKINGLSYRIFVYPTPLLDTSKPQPVIYLFDGNYYFAAACDAMRVNLLSGIVVGIGYPTDDQAEVVKRRTFDLSLPSKAGDKRHGGLDAFLPVVEKEIKPLVQSHYKIDTAHQAIYGHSLGGMALLHQMFTNPGAYSTYIAASPSIWWNGKLVLADEDAFSKKAANLHLKLLITSAGDEQYHGTDPAQLEKAHQNGMVDNASNLATRLAKLSPATVAVTRAIFPDETHRSGSIPSLVRGLRFTFHAAAEE